MAWTRILDSSAIVQDGMTPAAAGVIPLVVCCAQGRIHVFEDRCPHHNGPFSGGNFTDGRLICPWHAWEFVCETGCADFNPAVTLRRFRAKVEDGTLWIDA